MTTPLDQKYISTKEASQLTGYHSDYLARLCRTGEVKSTRIGRNWFVHKDALKNFVKTQEQEKKQQAQELAETRQREYQLAQKAKVQPAPVVPPPVRKKLESVRSPYFSFAPQAVAVFVALVVVQGGLVMAEQNVLVRGVDVVSKNVAVLADRETHIVAFTVYKKFGEDFVELTHGTLERYTKSIEVSGTATLAVGSSLRDGMNSTLHQMVLAEVAFGESLQNISLNSLYAYLDVVEAWPKVSGEIPGQSIRAVYAVGNSLAGVSATLSRGTFEKTHEAYVLGREKTKSAVVHSFVENVRSVVYDKALGIIGVTALVYDETQDNVSFVLESRVVESPSSAQLSAVSQTGIVGVLGKTVALPTYLTINSWFERTGDALAQLFVKRVAHAPVLSAPPQSFNNGSSVWRWKNKRHFFVQHS